MRKELLEQSRALEKSSCACFVCNIDYELFEEMYNADEQKGVMERRDNKGRFRWFAWKGCCKCEAWFCPTHADLEPDHEGGFMCKLYAASQAKGKGKGTKRGRKTKGKGQGKGKGKKAKR